MTQEIICWSEDSIAKSNDFTLICDGLRTWKVNIYTLKKRRLEAHSNTNIWHCYTFWLALVAYGNCEVLGQNIKNKIPVDASLGLCDYPVIITAGPKQQKKSKQQVLLLQ